MDQKCQEANLDFKELTLYFRITWIEIELILGSILCIVLQKIGKQLTMLYLGCFILVLLFCLINVYFISLVLNVCFV